MKPRNAECNGKCKPTIMHYDKDCLLHGWIEEADEVLYKNLNEADPCFDRNDRLRDKDKIGIYNAMKEYSQASELLEALRQADFISGHAGVADVFRSSTTGEIDQRFLRAVQIIKEAIKKATL